VARLSALCPFCSSPGTNPQMGHKIGECLKVHFLIFDKSSLESLNLDEAVMLDNFFMSNITPLFFVECLADLEKVIRWGIG
jgi:hypothetical protein